MLQQQRDTVAIAPRKQERGPQPNLSQNARCGSLFDDHCGDPLPLPIIVGKSVASRRVACNQLVTILVAYLLRSFVQKNAAMAEAWKKYPALQSQPLGLSDALESVSALKEAVAGARAVVEQRRQVIEAARK